jgi:hypothetical protein
MALLDWEGFDRETANLGIFSTFLGYISPDNSGTFGYGRCHYHNTAQASYAGRFNAFSNISTAFIQCHIYFNSGFLNFAQVWLMDGSSNQIGFRIGSDGKPQIVRGDNTVLASAASSVALNTWHFFQFRATVADAGGTAELRLNGQTIATYAGDTKNTTNAFVNGWKVEATTSGQTAWFDNIVIYSDTGNPPNTWTPETRIYEDLPNGAGAAAEWTPSAGANWQCVDEQPSNGDSDYVSAASSPLTDVYAFPATTVPTGSIVYGVAVHATARKDDAGTNDLDLVLRSGTTNYASGTSSGLTSTYVRYRRLWDTDPATGTSWTVSGANAASAGIRRTA